MKYSLEEIGFDTSIHDEAELIEIADCHCRECEGREHLLPIDTLDKAIGYFNDFGFKVKEA